MSISKIPPDSSIPYTPSSKKTDKIEKPSKLDNLVNYIIEIPESSIFYGTDIILVSDKAVECAPLPMNVMTETCYKIMEDIYHKIKNDDKDAVIHVADTKLKSGTKEISFKSQTMDDIARMMLRPIGRMLLFILTQNKPIYDFILINSGKESACEEIGVKKLKDKLKKLDRKEMLSLVGRKNMEIEITDRRSEYHWVEHLPSGVNAARENEPLFLDLAHELLHCLRDQQTPEGIKRRNTESPLDVNFHNLEEFMNITGWSRDPKSFFERLARSTKFEDVPTDPTQEQEEEFSEIYTKLNERDLTAEFTSKDNVFYPRADHYGVAKIPEETEEDRTRKQKLVDEVQNRGKLKLFTDLWDLAKNQITIIQERMQKFILSEADEKIVQNMVNELKESLDSLNYLINKTKLLSQELKSEIKLKLTFLLDNTSDTDLKDLVNKMLKNLS